MNARSLPLQLDMLAWRERELATIVYALGKATVKDVQQHVSSTIADPTIRTILRRMVRKGILRRHGDGKGRGQQIIYVPAITNEGTRRSAISQIAELYFGGSLAVLADMAEKMAKEPSMTNDEIQQASSFKWGTSVAPLSLARHAKRRDANFR